MRANYSRKFHFRMALSCHGALAHPPTPHCKIKNDPFGSFSILVGVGAPRYTITKIKKIFHSRFFKIFLIVYSRIGAALRSHRSTHPTLQNKKWPIRVIFYFGGSGWIRTTSGLSQQIYSLPRLSNSGARPELNFCGLPHEAFGEVWCGQRDSNPHIKLGRLAY